MPRKRAAKPIEPIVDRVLTAGGVDNLTNVELITALFGVSEEKAKALIEFRFDKAAKTSPASLVSLLDGDINLAMRFLLSVGLCGRIEEHSVMPKSKIGSPDDIRRYMMKAAGLTANEAMYVITLDAKNQVIRHIRLCQGSKDACLAVPADIIALAIMDNARGFIVYHNHPSGSLDMSMEDKILYGRLAKAGEAVGIQMIDGLVATDSGLVSGRGEGVV